DGRAGGCQRDAAVRCEHGIPFRDDAGLLVNAHRARDPRQRLTRDASHPYHVASSRVTAAGVSVAARTHVAFFGQAGKKARSPNAPSAARCADRLRENSLHFDRNALTVIDPRLGTISLSSSTHFAPMLGSSAPNPVMVAPGCA